MDAAEIFVTLITQRGGVRAIEYSKHSAYNHLLKAGFIEEAGVVPSLVCDECDAPHDATIVYEQEHYGYYCPDLGFVPKARSELITVKANIEKFVSNLAEHLDVRRRKTTPIAGDIWRVGVLISFKSDLAVYFCPTLRDAEDLEACRAALGREVKASYGIIFTALSALELPPYKTVNLTDALSFDAASRIFSLDFDLFEIAGVPVRKTGGRPSPYAKDLEGLIEQRVKSGVTLDGRNEEAKAVLIAFKEQFPTKRSPSLSTVKNYISEFRGG